jgi:hypothetical protein
LDTVYVIEPPVLLPVISEKYTVTLPEEAPGATVTFDGALVVTVLALLAELVPSLAVAPPFVVAPAKPPVAWLEAPAEPPLGRAAAWSSWSVLQATDNARTRKDRIRDGFMIFAFD